MQIRRLIPECAVIKVNKTATSVPNDSFSLICTSTAEKYGLHSAGTLPRLVVWKPKSSCLLSARLPLAEHCGFPRTDCNNNGHSFNHIAWHIAGDSVKTGGRDTEPVKIWCFALLFAYDGWMKVFKLSLDVIVWPAVAVLFQHSVTSAITRKHLQDGTSFGIPSEGYLKPFVSFPLKNSVQD